jgi:hypothetical protein
VKPSTKIENVSQMNYTNKLLASQIVYYLSLLESKQKEVIGRKHESGRLKINYLWYGGK